MSSDINLSSSETAPSTANVSSGASAAATQASSFSASTPAVDGSDAPSPSSEPASAALGEPASAATTTAQSEETTEAQDETAAAAATTTTQAPVAPTPPTPPAPVADAAIAERITIPGGHSNGDTSPSEGGEWELLTSKIKDWFDANDIGEQINRARQPLRLLAYVIGLLLVMKVYSGLLGAIGTIPLAPRLLELVGLCTVISFSATRLVRSNDRREVIDGLRQRWAAFSGNKN